MKWIKLGKHDIIKDGDILSKKGLENFCYLDQIREGADASLLDMAKAQASIGDYVDKWANPFNAWKSIWRYMPGDESPAFPNKSWIKLKPTDVLEKWDIICKFENYSDEYLDSVISNAKAQDAYSIDSCVVVNALAGSLFSKENEIGKYKSAWRKAKNPTELVSWTLIAANDTLKFGDILTKKSGFDADKLNNAFNKKQKSTGDNYCYVDGFYGKKLESVKETFGFVAAWRKVKTSPQPSSAPPIDQTETQQSPKKHKWVRIHDEEHLIAGDVLSKKHGDVPGEMDEQLEASFQQRSGKIGFAFVEKAIGCKRHIYGPMWLSAWRRVEVSSFVMPENPNVRQGVPVFYGWYAIGPTEPMKADDTIVNTKEDFNKGYRTPEACLINKHTAQDFRVGRFYDKEWSEGVLSEWAVYRKLPGYEITAGVPLVPDTPKPQSPAAPKRAKVRKCLFHAEPSPLP